MIQLDCRSLALALLVPPLLSLSGPSEDEDPFLRFELDRGVRLAVLHVPDAPRQSTFTFLPFGLAVDPGGGAQFAHLAEHMLIRSTDPDSLFAPGLQLNGETSAQILRMETYAEPQAWRESLGRHARWLAARAIDAGVLEAEKIKIAEEERTTTQSGYTHKWAEAAWNQVVRHGRDHAAVHGDVASAGAEQIATWIRERVGASPDVRIVSVGPVEPARIRDVLATELESAPPASGPGVARETNARTRSEEEPDLRATWDLECSHYLEWIRLSGDAVDRVAGSVLAQLVNMSLFQVAEGKLARGRAMARTLAVPEGRYLVLSASLSSADDRDAAHEVFQDAIEKAKTGAGMSLKMVLFQLRAQAGSVPNIEGARKQLESMGRDVSLVEAQLALNLVLPEVQLDLSREDLLSSWREVDEERVEKLAERTASERRRSLLLTPRR